MTAEIQIDLDIADDWRKALPEAETICRRAAKAVLVAVGPDRGQVELSLVLSDDAAVRVLNREYRGRDGATNVLSFPHADSSPGHGRPDGPPVLLGDVIVARETLVREAVAQGKTAADHLAHLVVHGILHLLGYDHEAEAEAVEMERIELSILSELGVRDPYALVDQAVG